MAFAELALGTPAGRVPKLHTSNYLMIQKKMKKDVSHTLFGIMRDRKKAMCRGLQRCSPRADGCRRMRARRQFAVSPAGKTTYFAREAHVHLHLTAPPETQGTDGGEGRRICHPNTPAATLQQRFRLPSDCADCGKPDGHAATSVLRGVEAGMRLHRGTLCAVPG